MIIARNIEVEDKIKLQDMAAQSLDIIDKCTTI